MSSGMRGSSSKDYRPSVPLTPEQEGVVAQFLSITTSRPNTAADFVLRMSVVLHQGNARDSLAAHPENNECTSKYITV
ncbi:hypothetical protein N7520_007755 [Penicillium odoratum]|uniref:uncharacterized protein n=1 Tax=Penicillium odoratum TaxID=1167516 RepID=UPI0025476BF6|nr:uncharacterized protein N7520_007755 [Penicillium odoratum]KAJ5760599.1 hypothetical protein N7520_007755 [Penicillium odoratum]